jgi:glycosyltransferase involved in cell wall biosynthesis
VRILYAAIDQVVPGTLGGSTHVQAVAEGLAALGHEVHVAVGNGGRNRTPIPPKIGLGEPLREHVPEQVPERVPVWHDVSAPPNLRLLRRGALRRIAAAVRPDVVVERYHNFGGEGLLAARNVGARTVLEVNAPVVDYPGSTKRAVDRLLIVEPMRRWREWQCRTADLIVTTDRRILPADTPASKIVETEWGADTARFRPGAPGAVPYARDPGDLVAVFAGAFRAWHGVAHLIEAMARLERTASPWRAVLIGDGPERSALAARASALGLARVHFIGALPYAAMPPALAGADAGLAPFDPDAHAALRQAFYWSPLKVFEYLASGLPVVLPDLPRLRAIVGDDAAVFYDRHAPDALATALDRLTEPAARTARAAAARRLAETRYSWTAHCRVLHGALSALLPAASAAGR